MCNKLYTNWKISIINRNIIRAGYLGSVIAQGLLGKSAFPNVKIIMRLFTLGGAV